MSWKFLIAQGRILKPDGSYHCSAYSGAPGYINNPQDEMLKDKGPLPEGLYHFGTPVDTDYHGPFCIPLIPDYNNKEFGRGGFMWHGDSIAHPGCASEGCIISIQLARRAAWSSNDHDLEVLSGEVEKQGAD